MSYSLSQSQQYAFDYILSNLSKEHVILVEGAAGTGKTTLTKTITQHFIKNGLSVCAIAPTHKAKNVILRILNQTSMIPITGFTVASALSKIKEHSYIGTKNYTNGNVKKLSAFKLLLIDEVSMIDDHDLKCLIDFARVHKKYMVIIGDSNQIACPSAKYVSFPAYIEKANSCVFTDPTITKLTLTDIVRQAHDSPIIDIAAFIAAHISQDCERQLFSDIIPSPFIIANDDAYVQFKNAFVSQQPDSVKLVAYTNQAVKTHNQNIRGILGYDHCPFMIGEILMGYANVGFPEMLIENGQDYVITKANKCTNHKIQGHSDLHGHIIHLKIANQSIKTPIVLFFVSFHDEHNTHFLETLIELAELVNIHKSTATDYRNYMALKNQVVFMEDVYKYKGIIYTETTFKETHPLLFTKVTDLILLDGNSRVCNESSQLYQKIHELYPQLVKNRLNDDKQMSDSENVADMFKVIEKDIYYGYAITVHKSQGSTYHTVIVDEPDFDKIKSRWNFRYGKMESRIREKNSMRYVGYTRAKEQLLVMREQLGQV
jgi:archaellum biogenesis ATPase FlaH